MNHRQARTTVVRLLSALLLAGCGSLAFAQQQPCFDRAKSNTEVDQCGAPLITHFEEKIESEYKRLHDKFAGNEKMQEILKASRESWDHYRNNQCTLEASAVSGRYAVQPFSVEANKVYFKCMLRTFGEMKSSLEKF